MERTKRSMVKVRVLQWLRKAFTAQAILAEAMQSAMVSAGICPPTGPHDSVLLREMTGAVRGDSPCKAAHNNLCVARR